MPALEWSSNQTLLMLERAFISQHEHVSHKSFYSPQFLLKSEWAVTGENMLHWNLFWILQTLFLFKQFEGGWQMKGATRWGRNGGKERTAETGWSKRAVPLTFKTKKLFACVWESQKTAFGDDMEVGWKKATKVERERRNGEARWKYFEMITMC